MKQRADVKTESRSKRVLRYCAVLTGVVVLLALGSAPLLRLMGSFLVVEDPLRLAAAIVVLGGQPPFREMEAARLFAQGWAPKVMVIPGALREEQQTLSKLGIRVAEGWEISREVLLKSGVPSAAIVVSEGRAEGTLEELQAAYKALASQRSDVSDQRSAGMTVILVSSKYHTRRVRLTWSYVTRGESVSIVRAAEGDPFDPARWWRERRFALSVVREYLGLINYYAGFPVEP